MEFWKRCLQSSFVSQKWLLILWLALPAQGFAATEAVESKSETQSKVQFWGQVAASVSILDTKTDAPVQRFGVGSQFGARKGSWGAFLNAEMIRSLEFTTQRPDIHFLQIGPGLEFISRERNIRSSVSSGATVLTANAGASEAGKVGWYVDLRPVSVRYPLEGGGVIEFTPLTIDISIPSSDSNLAMYGNFTVLSYEWGSR